MIEVTLDQAAAELGIDPLEIRRKNFIPKEDFPAETAVGVTYDSGDYEKTLDRLLEHVDVAAFRREQEELCAKGTYRGIGFSTYTEICGLAPTRVVGPEGFGNQAGFWESAMVRVHNTGAVTVYKAVRPTARAGPARATTPSNTSVTGGRGGDLGEGTGPEDRNTYGLRSLSVGGEALAKCATKIADKAKAIVAHQLEADPEDVEVSGDKFAVRGSPDKGMTLAEVAGAAYLNNVPTGMEPGLEATTFWEPENFVFPFGAHACIVDVDPETGKTKVVRYVAVDDCGNAIHPLLIAGQIYAESSTHGRRYERIHYDEDGQLVTGTFVDYALPTAAELPSFELDRTETPSPVNSMGVKGVGEAGTIAASPAVTNAVIDALRPLGVTYINMPLSPMRVWEAIEDARGGVPA